MLPTYIFVISFLGVFFILIASIPPQLITEGYEGETISYSIPTGKWASADILELGWYDNGTLKEGETLFLYLPNTGDSQIDLTVNWNPDYSIRISHTFLIWWIFPSAHYVYTSDTIEDHFSYDYVESFFDEATNISSFKGQCEHGTLYYIYVSFNITEYSSLLDAWNNHEIEIMIGVRLEETLAKFNAWSLIGSLLTFSMPQIHPVLNMIIAIPIWACIIYLLYRLILLAIPFVGG